MNDATHLPTANTCMNVLNLPNYKNKELLKKKLLYAISAKAGFEFAWLSIILLVITQNSRI